jgi:nitrilase
MKIALVQISSNSNIEKNYNKFTYFLELSKVNKSELIIFPENTFFIGNINNYKETTIDLNQNYLPRILEKIKKTNMDVIIGGMPFLKENGEIVNRLLYINKNGEIETHYDKIHLFKTENITSSLNEASYLTRGNKVVTIKKDEFTLGLSICYDLRFPELYRALIDKGADVLIVPAAFTYKTGKLHWLELLKARAIENQSYVLGVNQVGDHENFGTSYGVTSLIKPTGENISLNDKDEDVLFFDLVRSDIDKFRNWIPSLNNRVTFE